MPRYARLLPLLLVTVVAACSKDNPVGPPVVTTVFVTPGTDTLIALGRTRQFTAVPKDANGNPVGGVTLVWRSSNPAVATVDSATGIVTAVGNGLSVIRADAGGVIGQATLAVVQVVATVQVTPGSKSFTAVGDTQRFVAVAKDSGGAAVQGVRFLWGSSTPNVATVDTLGLATSHAPGQATISAAGRGVPGYAGVAVTQTALGLYFNIEPSYGIAGDPISPAVQVEVLDAQGHLVADNRDAIALDIFDYQGAGSGISLHGTTTVNAVGGVATFSGLWLTGAGRYVLSATDTALGNESITDPFVVAPANPDQLTFPNQPLSIRGSDTLRTLTVVVRDQFGNDVTNYVPGNIALDFAVNPWAGVSPASGDSAPGAFLSGTTLLPPDSGRAVFAGLSVDKPGYGYQLRARLPSLPAVIPAVSSPFNVTLQFAPLVAAGNAHTCAVTTKGTYCWGSNSGGQLAGVTGPSGSDSVPQPASGGLSLVAIASKQAHTCGLTALGDAYCWGGAPLLVGGGHTFVAIAAGQSHNCAITGTGALYCWGSNASGQLGDGTKTFRSNPVLVAGGLSFKAVGAGSDFTCALTVAGAAYCWGSNTQGQMGTGGAAPDSVPQPVTGGHTFASLVAGLFHSCATATDSTAYCWGGNSSFQDGDGTGATTPHTSPNLVAGSHKYTALTAGELHTCGLIVGGAALCWGANDAGQLGPGFASSGTSNPLGVVGRVFTAVVAGGHHTCGLSGGALYCWGSDTFGQLGDGRSNMQLAPVRVVQ